MLSKESEKLLAKILSYGSAFTAIFLLTTVNDPVNLTKFASLGVVAMAALGVFLSKRNHVTLKAHGVLFSLLIVFVLSGFNAAISSSSPLSQNLYGVHGRNNGLLTYLFLAIILGCTLALKSRNSFERIVIGLILAGIVNVAYSLWALLFGDFIGWNNPYGNILGTFGNPNFIGAFLGIFLAVYFAFGLSKSRSIFYRWSLVLVLPITAYEIIESNAIQGRVVGALGLAIVGFFQIRSKFSALVTAGYSAFCAVIGGFALAGALQVGPLTEYIYKRSVSLRGQYWLSGWNAGESHPFTGVGMDALGDWYRRTRDIHALEMPGVNTTINAAHNVPLDMFAFGGWPLFISYLSIVLIAAIAIVKVTLRNKDYDPVFVALTVGWVGYQVQSIISINQIGLAIWGWLLSGAVIAFEYSTRTATDIESGVSASKKARNTQPGYSPKLILIASTTSILGLLISLPPLTSDTQWNKAQRLQSVQAIEKSMKESYFNPHNSVKFSTNIQSLENSGFPDLAHKYTLKAIAWNPDEFTFWKILYLIKNSTDEERALAVSNLKRLDPLNPDVTAQ
jgi:hypothetical protein